MDPTRLSVALERDAEPPTHREWHDHAQKVNLMPTPLAAWQHRLEAHFGELAASRSASGFPIFALEHGLGPAELEEISALLRLELASGARLYPHWLLWVVYSTERDYGYDGHEYWVSFEEATPQWGGYSSARALRSYFSKFQKTYNGVVPSGPWADWFCNIAWPITHAILPRYLQFQFAKALYDARLQFARAQNPTPAEAGKLLANYAWDATSRFQEFLEQQELAGRIVLALLGQGTVKGQSPIYPPTLERIVVDLVKVRSAGEYLREARRVVVDRLHGLDRSAGGYAPGRDGSGARTAVSAAPPPSVRPAFLLRRSSVASWSVVIEVPDFSDVARLSPELSQFLKTTRCTLAGTAGAMLPAGWTLYAQQRRVMKSWPQAGTSMIAFERHSAVLENILRGECRFPQGPVWVFRVGNDGLAREITGKTVRPGQQYIVLSQEPLKTSLAFATPVNVECAGVAAMMLALPEAVEREATAELHKLGLQVVRNIRVWPAGLCTRNWDGEGHGDWLSTEAPCFGIVHDYAVEEYNVRLNHDPEVTIEGTRAGHPIFVHLAPLPPGRHVLSVRAIRIGLLPGAQALRDLEGRIELKVRDPTPWKSGTTSHPGLAVSLDPPDPSLDAFWEGNIRLSVLGPEGRDVACSMSLTGRNGAFVLSEEIGKFDLPITPSNWTQRFKRFASDDSRAWKYLEASRGQFVIKGEELGEYALPLERDARPVRWICRMARHATEVRLVDDTGQEQLAEAMFCALKRPDAPQALDSASAMAGKVAEEPGGLFYARQGEHHDALVVSSSRGAVGFRDLLVEPDLNGGPPDVTALLSLVDLWHQARLAGPLADSRRDLIARRLLARLYLALCGSRWSHAEDAFFRNPHVQDFQQLERAVEGRASFAVVLRQSCAKMEQGTTLGARWFSEVAGRYGVCQDPALCAFALRLASRPFALGKQPDALFVGIRQNAVLMRGARLVALHCIAADRDRPGDYLARWAW
jgi:hypothetical protein